MSPPIASFHLVRYRRRRVPAEMVRFLTQRPALRRATGLRFARLLGTARGRSMSLSADLTRWALFAVWDDDETLDRFLAGSSVALHWQRRALESYTVRLAPLAAHGAWGGTNPLGDLHGPTMDVAPLAVLTRATVRPRRWRPFYEAAALTDAALGAAPGLLAAVGVGERPVGRQATFSLWSSARDVSAFAYRDAYHTEVIRRTRDERWYSEELFARFRPYRAEGTWNGLDPLDDLAARSRNSAGMIGSNMP